MEAPQVIQKAGRWHGLNFIKKQCETQDSRLRSPLWNTIGKLIFPNIHIALDLL